MRLQSIRNAEVGQNVIVRWTNCGHQYTVPATVEKLNAKTLRVKLAEHVPYQDNSHGAGKIAYPAGRSIIVPVWPFSTTGNGIFEEVEPDVDELLEVQLNRVIDERGCSRNVAKIHLGVDREEVR